MELTVDFGNPVFDEQAAWAITPEDLDHFYCSAGEVDQLNLFFQLEASFRRHLEAGRAELAAHLAFLTAYYLFTPLTPPASWELATYYIREALRLHPAQEYREWCALIEKGN